MKYSPKIDEINNVDTGIYQGNKRPAELKAELEALLGFVSDYEANLDEIDEIDSKIEDNLEKKIELQIEKFNNFIWLFFR